MRLGTSQKIFLASFFYLIGLAYSQSNHIYFHENPNHVFVGEDVYISQLLFTQDPISHGFLFFRNKGEISYQEVPMIYEGGKWVGNIPSHRVTQPGIEYVTILTKQDGGRIALPLSNSPFDTPLFFKVTQGQSKQKDDFLTDTYVKRSTEYSGDYVDADILILSPDDGSLNRPDEVVISVSLFNAPIVDQTQFQLWIDGTDFTDQTVIFGDVLSLVPDGELDVGLHKVKLLFKSTYGMDIFPVEWSFNVNRGMENLAKSFIYKGSFSAKKSTTSSSSITIDEDEKSGKFSGELSWIKGRYSFRNSSRESVFRQPLNRSTLSLQITDYLKIENGDVYPSISPYLLDGKRVDGRHIHADFNYGFKLFKWEIAGSFELQTVFGKLTRDVQYQNGIDGAYELLTNDTKYDDYGNFIYKISRKGYTFPRDVVSTRLGFSLFNKYRGGIHFLKAKDDFDKINVKGPTSSLFTVDTSVFGDSLTQYYTLAQFADSLANSDDTVLVKPKNWDDGSPEENLVLGFDFESALDNRKLLFQMGWNMSMTNSNIWAGIASKDSLDLMMDTLSDGMIMGQYDVSAIGETIEKYENIFTIHPFYMSPIAPIDPIVAQKSVFKAFLNMPASAYYLRVKGSYSFNNILIEYKQHGSQFKSFGNPYLTNNIREFTLNDRLSLLGRRLMIVAGYKYRDNNLSETVAHPVATKTISINTTLVPGPGAPSIIMNLQTIGRTNGIDSAEFDQYGNFLSDNRENSKALNIMASVNLPGNFGNLATTTSINVNSISYTDNLSAERKGDFLFQKAETQSVSLTFSTRFQIPLKTSVSYNRTQLFIPYMNENNVPYKDESTWTSMGMTAQYSFFKNAVRFRGGLDFMTNGETDESETNLYGGKIGGDWDIMKKMTLTFNSSIRMNNIKIYKTDEIDNDNNGLIDESRENWMVSSSGFNLSLGYRF